MWTGRNLYAPFVILSGAKDLGLFSLLGLAGWITAHMRDIAPPDTSDLAIETVKIADANNACVRFRRAGDLSTWPRNDSRAKM
jgi:hypothetical protein